MKTMENIFDTGTINSGNGNTITTNTGHTNTDIVKT